MFLPGRHTSVYRDVSVTLESNNEGHFLVATRKGEDALREKMLIRVMVI